MENIHVLLSKQKEEGEVTELVQGTIHRASTVKRNILSSMSKDGAELDDIENNAEQLLDRIALNKIRIQGKGESESSKLVKLKDRYKKNGRFFAYRLNIRDHNSQPTYVLKTSASAVEMGKKLDRDGDHYLNSSYVHFDGNEKRVSKMTTLTLSLYHPLIQKSVILATFQCERENSESAELFWKCWNDVLNEDGDAHAFNPTGIILDERSGNWRAIENIFGKEFLRIPFQTMCDEASK